VENWAIAVVLAIVVASAACGKLNYDPLGGGISDGGAADAEDSVPVPTVATGNYLGCALTPTGDLYCWGGNYTGELGQGDYDTRSTPVLVGSVGQWRAVTCGWDHVCAADQTGDVYCWGANGNGDLGVGDYDERLTPALLVGPNDIVALASGASDNLGLSSSGERWGWGDNRNTGALGTGDDLGPVIDPVLTDEFAWRMVAVGDDTHSCGIRTDGSLWCWGLNEQGQLGIGDQAPRFAPTQVEPSSSWTWVAVGVSHTCGVRDGGALACWGANNSGQLGDQGGNVSEPRAVMPERSFARVDASLSSTCAIDSDDQLWCWGQNGDGQLGLGTTSPMEAPTQVASGSRWSSVDLDWYHGCGAQADGSVFCWGRGGDGQLGSGDTADAPVPVEVSIPVP
jgi:alpha-tubulin suppressor-like RCC1 family protein